jgi:hypothetical protein
MAWYENREVKAYYEATWRKMLQALLDWPEEQAARWAKYRIDQVGDSPFLSHETAT